MGGRQNSCSAFCTTSAIRIDSFPSIRGGKLFAKVLLRVLPGKPLKPIAYADQRSNLPLSLRQELRCKPENSLYVADYTGDTRFFSLWERNRSGSCIG